MPRLFQINTTVGRGSTGTIAELISFIAREAGWECFIAHGSRYVGNSEMSSFQVSGRLDEFNHYALSRVFDRHGLGSCAATKRLVERIEEVKPDVVQIHNIHGYYINYEILLRYLAAKGIPTVVTIHDFWLMTGHCAYINKSCNKWEIGCGSCPRLKEYPAAIIDRTRKNWSLKKAVFDRFMQDKLVFVTVSRWLESYAKRSLLGGHHIRVIQNGVSTALFKPYEGAHTALWKGIDWNKYTILSVADRWTEANGFNDILALNQILPDDTQIVVVGLNKKQLHDLPEKMVGVGHTDNVLELLELYTSADVLFNPSTEVTFGLVTAEAMACGTPAIVFKNTAGEEIINAETGYAIDDIKEIPEMVRKFRENASSYIINCRKRIVQNFDSLKQFSKYITLYSELLNLGR